MLKNPVPVNDQRSVNNKRRESQLQRRPERTCLGCGVRFEKIVLLRFVVHDGRLLADPEQHLSGRGVYCCRLVGCLKKFAAKKGRLSRVLREEVVDCQAVMLAITKASADTGRCGKVTESAV